MTTFLVSSHLASGNNSLLSYVVADEDFGERNVSVVLDEVESELVFIDHTNGEMSVRKGRFYTGQTIIQL